MKNAEWKEQFSARLLKFSVDIVKISSRIPKTPAGFAIASQLVRSGTSVGANFQEAQDASSPRDFIHKISISLRESKETLYWLTIINETCLLEGTIELEIVEINELIAVLTSIVKTSKLKIV